MREVLTVYDDFRDATNCDAKIDAQIKDITEKTETLQNDVNERISELRGTQSVVSGLSRLGRSTTSSKRSEKQREETARARELEVRLQYMEKDEQLQKQLEDINRQKRKREVVRQHREAIARARVYDDDDDVDY